MAFLSKGQVVRVTDNARLSELPGGSYDGSETLQVQYLPFCHVAQDYEIREMSSWITRREILHAE